MPFSNALCMVFPFWSLASARQRVRVSGFIPVRVPVYSFPFVVVTVTVLSSRAAISAKNFLWAADNFSLLLVILLWLLKGFFVPLTVEPRSKVLISASQLSLGGSFVASCFKTI